MRSPNDLRKFVNEAAALLAREKDLAAFEVYASTAEHRVARLNYTSDIPSQGVEEFKSLNADGFMIRIVMRRDAHEIGSASTAGDLSLDAVRDALSRARRSLIIDPHFPGFVAEPRKLGAARDADRSDLIRVNDGVLAKAAWQIVGGAIAAFEKRAPLKLAHPGLGIGGAPPALPPPIAITNSAFYPIRNDHPPPFPPSPTPLAHPPAPNVT